jgi:pheromone alpha factor receptor
MRFRLQEQSGSGSDASYYSKPLFPCSSTELDYLVVLRLSDEHSTSRINLSSSPFLSSEYSISYRAKHLKMPSASNSTNSTFDPYTQPVTIYMANGVTPVTFLLSDLDAFNYYNGACGINYGCQMGACFVMCFVIIVLTKESKRRSAMFILNLLSLLFGFFRALLLVLFFVGPWSQTYPQFTGDLTYIPRSAFASSIAGVVMPLFMTITVDMSLVLQAYTVCKSMRTIYRHIITVVSCIVLLVTVGFRFAQMVTNAMTIVRFEQYFGNAWIQTGTLATETGSIWFFSIIFTGKLVWTLVTRKIMGWKQWSGVRILAAMGGCTMIVPCTFCGKPTP